MGAGSPGLTERAKLLIAERKYQEAVRTCRRALLTQPDETEVRLLLGQALLALGRYEEARVEMVALARKEPAHADVQRMLGEAYLRAGRPGEASECLRRALELNPSDETARKLLSEATVGNAPASATIEHWFGDEATPTVVTQAPPSAEETTRADRTAAKEEPADTGASARTSAGATRPLVVPSPRTPVAVPSPRALAARAGTKGPVVVPSPRASATSAKKPSATTATSSPAASGTPKPSREREAAALTATAPRRSAPGAVATPTASAPTTKPAPPPAPAPTPTTAAPVVAAVPPATSAPAAAAVPPATSAPTPTAAPPAATAAPGTPLAPKPAKMPPPRAVRSRYPTLAGAVQPGIAPPSAPKSGLANTGVPPVPFPTPRAPVPPAPGPFVAPDSPAPPSTHASRPSAPTEGGTPPPAPSPFPNPSPFPPTPPSPFPPSALPASPDRAPTTTAAPPIQPEPTSIQKRPRSPEPATEELDLDPAHETRDFETLDDFPEELSGTPTRTDVLAPDFHAVTNVRSPAPAAPPSLHAHAAAPAVPRAAPDAAPKPPPPPQPEARSMAAESPPNPLTTSSSASSPAPAPTAKGGARTRWVVLAAVGGLVAVLVVAAGVLGVTAWRDASAREAIGEAARAAGDSGLRADLEAAIARIHERGSSDPDLIALEARLAATLVLEHDEDARADAVRALLARAGSEQGADARIATALLDLDRGDAAGALTRLSGLAAQGEQIAEAFRARALATAALGRQEEAEDAARRAAELRPTSPRHVALHALMQHRRGESARALALLDAIPGGDRAAAVRIARARVLDESGTDPARARDEASAVLDSEGASPHELAWARLLLAKHAVRSGDVSAALSAARAAAEHAPPVDEAFGLLLVETLLRAGAADEARSQLATLPPPADAAARALIAAEVALAQGDFDAADAALAQAGEGARRSLLRGRLLEARGDDDAARLLYEEAMAAAGPEEVRARVRLAAIALRGRDPQRAIALLEPARAGAAEDVELAGILARAYLAQERLDDATSIVDAAMQRRPDATELLSARAAIELRRGDAAQAFATLQRAVAARPADAELQAELGAAALAAGELDAARAAFETALARRPAHRAALVGLARLALLRGDLALAEQHLDAAAGASGDDVEGARVRGELLVRRGDGALGVTVLEPLAQRYDDALVWLELGYLQAQAEDDRGAARSFARALGRLPEAAEAHLGESLVAVRRGDLVGASRAVDRAAEQGASLGDDFRARLAIARARIEFERGKFDAVVRLANEALALDARSAAAHVLLANVAVERDANPIEHLRRAVEGDAPPPEALGRLAVRLGNGEEACRLARRYLEVAPNGFDAQDVRAVLRRCP